MPFAIRNAQGYWCGTWNDRATAENVLSKGNPGDGEKIVELREVKGAVEIRSNADGSLDEVCALNYHLEQMSATHWWMAVDDARGSVHVNLHSKATIRTTVIDERKDAP